MWTKEESKAANASERAMKMLTENKHEILHFAPFLAPCHSVVGVGAHLQQAEDLMGGEKE